MSFSYRSTRMGALSKTYVIANGVVLSPVHVVRSRSGNHGEDIYLRRDVEEADVILHIDISNSNKHRCRIEIRRDNVASLAKALEIHRCPAVVASISGERG